MKKILKVCAKCSDMFTATLEANGEMQSYDGYVPNWFPNLNTRHYGDYVQLDIDVETGKIINWVKPTDEQLDFTFMKNE